MFRPLAFAPAAVCALIANGLIASDTVAQTPQPRGYYRFPAIHGETIVFTAEGDLWKVATAGGIATRLTTHASEESRPALSPDGRTIAYSASYEGPREVYTMPLTGGAPVRQTYDGIAAAEVVGWTMDGRILYTTDRFSTLPNWQLVALTPCSAGSLRRDPPCAPAKQLLPLAQASDGSLAPDGTLYFTRLAWQGSQTKRYKGGTAQNLWRFRLTDAKSGEAAPLTGDWQGTSKTPMLWNGRIYFASDRDGVMNIWSMSERGGDLKQHTSHKDYDVQWPALHDGRIVYQQGADLWFLDLRSPASSTSTSTPSRKLDITLPSDFEQMRENWVERPMDFLTSVHVSPTGDRVVLTSRGRVFVAPVGPGRFVQVTRKTGVRYRDARFNADGKELVALSDESGEAEVWTLPASGIGKTTQLTTNAAILRWDAVPSPDGKYIKHHDKNQNLYIYDVAKKTDRKIATSSRSSAWISSAPGYFDAVWSPDGRWLAYNDVAENYLGRIMLYDTESNTHTALTTDRYNSYSPAWSPDGQWIYFLSDRSFQSLVGSPWGARAPDPFFDKQTRVFAVSLQAGLRSPFKVTDELVASAPPSAVKDSPQSAPRTRRIDLEGITTRLIDVPVPPGNYDDLTTDGKRLYYLSLIERSPSRTHLMSIEISNKTQTPAPVIEEVASYELSQDRKKLMVRKAQDIYVFDAGAKAPASLTESKVDLSAWSFSVDPREEWRHHFVDAWRLERDYFYDPGMHGVDWKAMREKYSPLADRVTDRAELNDVIAQMVGELSALHIFVRGGDVRPGTDNIAPASLGATLERDDAAGGWRVSHIYRSDPDIPDEVSPLAQPGVEVKVGDVIMSIDGVPTLSVADPAVLLRNTANRQVLLHVKSSQPARAGGAPPNQSSQGTRGIAIAERDVIVTPITQARERDLRYDEWEYTRRLAVDSLSNNRIGYVHLRAMGTGNIAEWLREYYPVFNRSALIIDVRHNTGGNIDSWLLGKLLRKEWFWWQPRVGEPYHNMPYAFRGPIVVLMNERTASDGEAFAEGFRRLGLGKLIGTRSWGGEIWLSSNNFLADRGIATAAEQGVFADGKWLIEGWGVDPDVAVDNLPAATFRGVDAQLERAVQDLENELKARPIPVVTKPGYPGARGR